MLSWQERRLTKAVKEMDSKLFVRRNKFGVLNVLRESYSPKPYLVDDCTIYVLEPAHHLVLSLTHNWTSTGKPVEWGVEPLINRLKAIDSWNDESFVSKDLEKHNKKVDESNERDIKNKLEAAAYESHSVFKKTFSDINTASMAKIDKRKRKGA